MISKENLYALLEEVTDPEIPVLSIREIGILREINWATDHWEIVITPTYSGCPAMHAIEMSINFLLISHGLQDIKVITKLSPAWTTDWMPIEAKNKLLAYGIAPPNPPKNEEDDRPKSCPVCSSTQVSIINQFGSTSCKSLWKCDTCLEPFDYFKCH